MRRFPFLVIEVRERAAWRAAGIDNQRIEPAEFVDGAFDGDPRLHRRLTRPPRVATTRTPWARTASAAVCSVASDRAHMPTSAPSAANCSAMARPMPLLDAATNAARPRSPRSMAGTLAAWFGALADVRLMSAEAHGCRRRRGHTRVDGRRIGKGWSLPLLPAGTTIFEGLPMGALVLAALAPAVGNGVITLHDGANEGVLVIRDGAISETMWVCGRRAKRWRRSARDHACGSGGDGVGVPPVRRRDGTHRAADPERPCYADLRLEWVVWPELLRRSWRARQDLCRASSRRRPAAESPSSQVADKIATFAESQPDTCGPAISSMRWPRAASEPSVFSSSRGS